MIEMRDTQNKLVNAERKAAVTHMAIALSHEINNPLQNVMGYAELLAEKAPDGDPDGEVYRILLDNARRIRDIIRKIQNLRDVVETEYTRGRLMVDVDASSGDE